MANERNAGRKRKFNKSDVDKMFALINAGKNIEEIAKKYNTSRQIIGRYINRKPNQNFTHRMRYMYGHKPMTIIYVDLLAQKIMIQNRTKNIILRAFGKKEKPDWDDFEKFLEYRTFDKSRINKNDILKYLKLDSYDPLLIINKTKGKIAGDNFWVDMKKL